ncbi:GM10518 [Drosophila sechellia]|uniref:GM10518 n=1 Tax=Drosophila sechellia TaxID=7238 RepID=B4I4L9_DROSE|nr:GM10518 [Drosophila sechellia]
MLTEANFPAAMPLSCILHPAATNPLSFIPFPASETEFSHSRRLFKYHGMKLQYQMANTHLPMPRFRVTFLGSGGSCQLPERE